MVKNYSGESLKDLKGLWLVDFYAEWCGPCKMMGPVLETLEGIEVLKINVDENQELAKEYNVMSIPYMLILKDGEKAAELVGFHTKDDIDIIINELK